jgi:hypothetical protein
MNSRLRNKKGQALLEVVVFIIALTGLLSAIVTTTKWFLIRQKLLIAVRHGAMMYSSGHYQSDEVQVRIKRFLSTGHPALQAGAITVEVGRFAKRQSYHLDEIRVRYSPPSTALHLIAPVMEEKCYIKHAPRYGPPAQTFFGPPVSW